MDYADIIAFHGHTCPGLAIGYRMSRAAMSALGLTRSGDEELYAVVENDACGVDALQYLTGCTFGKGNLLFRDYGKQTYTLFSRTGRKGVRVVFREVGIPAGLREDRGAFAEYLLSCPDEAILAVTEVPFEEPGTARIRRSVTCAICGEAVMDTRLREVNGLVTCIPCAERQPAT